MIHIKTLDTLSFPAYSLQDSNFTASVDLGTDFYLEESTLTQDRSLLFTPDGAVQDQEVSFWLNDNNYDFTLTSESDSNLYTLNSGSTVPVMVSLNYDSVNDWQVTRIKQLATPVTQITWCADSGISGSAVAEWQSVSSSVSLTQVSSSNRPNVTTASMGGRTCVDFSSANKTYMLGNELASLFSGNDNPWTFAIQFELTSATTLDSMLYIDSLSDGNPLMTIDVDNPTIRMQMTKRSDLGTDYVEGEDSHTLSASTEYVLIASYSGTKVTWYLNDDKGNTNTVDTDQLTAERVILGTKARAISDPITYAGDFLNAAVRRIEIRDAAVSQTKASQLYSEWYGN